VLTAAVFAIHETITAHELPASIQHCRPSLCTSDNSSPLEKVEKDLIFEALKGTSGHQQKAARILGISRRTLSRKLRTYSLHKA
jgi:DNA-binding NtrC family response regulator